MLNLIGPFLMQSWPFIAFSFLATFVFTLVVIKIAPYWGIIDDPRRPHPGITHTRPIPRGGGLGLWLGSSLTILLFLPLSPLIKALLIGSLVNVAVGILDDRYNLSPYLRLLVTLPLSALPLIWTGYQLTLSNPWGGEILQFRWAKISLGQIFFYLPEALLIIFWVVWLTNLVNWSKGVSQLPGVAVISFLTLAGVALKYQAGNPHQILTAQLGLIFAASCLAFLPFNFPPERIFPGFGGSTWIGFNLAALSLLSGGKLAAALLVLGIPTADMFLTIFSRLRQKKNPLYAGRDHLYHLLLALGLTKRQIIFSYWAFSSLLGLIALQLERRQKLFALLSVLLATGGIFLFIHYLVSRNKKKF